MEAVIPSILLFLFLSLTISILENDLIDLALVEMNEMNILENDPIDLINPMGNSFALNFVEIRPHTDFMSMHPDNLFVNGKIRIPHGLAVLILPGLGVAKLMGYGWTRG